MDNEVKSLIEKYAIKDEKEFERFVKIAEIALIHSKRLSKGRTLTIVGGQAGAGKSRLVSLTMKDLNNDCVALNVDELKCYHPRYDEINKNHPQLAHEILYPDIENVKNRVVDFVMDKGYNIIYEGGLRYTNGFLDIAKRFTSKDYKINMNILAVPKLESFGSTLVRYAYALDNGQIPRWVEKFAHDGSFEGVPRTVQAFIDNNYVENINVYRRGEDEPQQIYSTKQKQFPNAIEAIEYGRKMDRRKAVENFQKKYEYVKDVFSRKQPELLPRLDEWVELYDEEKNYFDLLDSKKEK